MLFLRNMERLSWFALREQFDQEVLEAYNLTFLLCSSKKYKKKQKGRIEEGRVESAPSGSLGLLKKWA